MEASSKTPKPPAAKEPKKPNPQGAAAAKPKPALRSKEPTASWWLVDAEQHVLGRLATLVASRLRGKHRVDYTPHRHMGDFVVVINAEKVRLTGNKLGQKKYFRHSGYVGSMKETSLKDQLRLKPQEVLRHAVRGMLPKNRLSRSLERGLKIYKGAQHPHKAQKPEMLGAQ